MSDTTFDCETATAAELAGALIDYIGEHGWTRGTLVEDQDDPDASQPGAVCLVGALGGVCAGDPKLGYQVCSGTPAEDDDGRIYRKPVSPSVLALGHALANEGTFAGPLIRVSTATQAEYLKSSPLVEFNDSRKSVDQVLAPLKRVAAGEVK